jgi:CBS domain-containing protein
MNIASFLTTKSEIAFLYDDFTLRQGLEKMHHHGYTAIPVVTRDNRYVSTVSEGDFLWYLVDDQENELHRIDIKSIEDTLVKDVIVMGKNPPVRITANIEELLVKAMNQNFIPVIDDRGYFIGIITRRDIINYFYQESLNISVCES